MKSNSDNNLTRICVIENNLSTTLV